MTKIDKLTHFFRSALIMYSVPYVTGRHGSILCFIEQEPLPQLLVADQIA